MNNELLVKCKIEKVWKALKQMHPIKSPGLNGMSLIFYQKYWDIVGTDVVNYVLNTLNSGIMPCGLNETYICLILKVKSHKKLLNLDQ